MTSTKCTNAVLTVNKLVTGYIEPIVKEVDLSIEQGKLTILIGSNGCGKSTLLKCMARVIKPFSGDVLLYGESLHKLPPKSVARQLALLPQGPITPEGLTVKQLVMQGRYPHHSLFKSWNKQDDAAVEQAMVMADVVEIQNKAMTDLSGGQRQRCWIAMVLAQQTDLILLDEPTTYLDLKVQVDLLNLLQTLAHKHGRTLVVVLHELNLASAYADHLVMMKQGEVYVQGSPRDVFNQENLLAVFGLDAVVTTEPNTQQLLCIPLQRSE